MQSQERASYSVSDRRAGCSDRSSWGRTFLRSSSTHSESPSSFCLDFCQNLMICSQKRRRMLRSPLLYSLFFISPPLTHTLRNTSASLWNSSVACMSSEEKTILLTKEWVSISSSLPVRQSRYPSSSGRRLCVPPFRKVCLFHNCFILSFLSECVGQIFRTISLSMGNNGRIHNLLIFLDY